VAFVAAARLARHEPEHPATPAAAAAAASDVSKTIFARPRPTPQVSESSTD